MNEIMLRFDIKMRKIYVHSPFNLLATWLFVLSVKLDIKLITLLGALLSLHECFIPFLTTPIQRVQIRAFVLVIDFFKTFFSRPISQIRQLQGKLERVPGVIFITES